MKEEELIVLIIVGVIGYYIYTKYLKKPAEPGKISAEFVETGVI